MTSVQTQEDLEARIARIKKRNEEIEQKYREAEEDRLRAMKENAMVEMRPPKDDDWPREHKYDKIDFNYDLDPATLAQLEEKKKEKDAFIQKIAKDYKVFAEGEGPPPDPAYSFLADVERDGEKAAAAAAAVAAGNNGNNNPNSNNNNNGSSNSGSAMASPNGGRSPPQGPGKAGGAGDHFDRRNPHNRSGHQHRQGPRDAGGPPMGGGRARGGPGKSGHQHHHGHHHGPNIQRSFSTNEHDGWRSASGEQQRRGAGGKGGPPQEGGAGGLLWRREQPHDAAGSMDAKSKDDSSLGQTSASGKPEPANLTVSVSRDGEFKSVKVTTPPIIGSGRVGPRQAAKPQFQFHSGSGDNAHHPHHNHHHHHHHHGGGHGHGHGHQPLPLTVGGGRRDAADHFNRNVTGRKSDRGGEGGKKHTSGTSLQNGKAGSTATATVSAGTTSSSSVQDRLNRNRLAMGSSSDRNENNVISKARPDASTQPPVSGAAKATLKTISKIIEKNAEIDEQLARDMARESEKLASKVKELRLQQQQQQQ